MRAGSDLVAYIALSAFPVSYFVLSTYNTSQFGFTLAFAIMLTVSVLALLMVKLYMPGIGEEEEDDVADFDENMTGRSLFIAVLLGLAVVIVVGLMAQLPQQSVLFIPRPDVRLFAAGPMDPQLVGNVLYQFTLVAPAEETLKTVGIYALWSRVGNEWAAVAPPVGLWAAFHTILAGFSPWMVIIAFVAGIVFYAGMRYTGSILTPTISHAIYNSTVVVLGG